MLTAGVNSDFATQFRSCQLAVAESSEDSHLDCGEEDFGRPEGKRGLENQLRIETWFVFHDSNPSELRDVDQLQSSFPNRGANRGAESANTCEAW